MNVIANRLDASRDGSAAFAPRLSIVVPTFGREEVLIETLGFLGDVKSECDEIILVDQTLDHSQSVALALSTLETRGAIRRIVLDFPSIPRAMNVGLRAARAPTVLFVDDDVRPEDKLFDAHLEARRATGAALVAGRVIQPWQEGIDFADATSFHFATLQPGWIEQFIGCNFSVDRNVALTLGGFDENFVRVAYRFEAEFACRLRAAGHRIFFEPKACLHHLKVRSGGTRVYGEHLRTARGDHSVGEYYFLFRTWRGWASLWAFVARPVQAVGTRHHLRRPWWIPATLVGELTGMIWAAWLAFRGPRYADGSRPPRGGAA